MRRVDKGRRFGLEAVRRHSGLWKRGEKPPRTVDSTAGCVRVWTLKPQCLGSSHFSASREKLQSLCRISFSTQ